MSKQVSRTIHIGDIFIARDKSTVRTRVWNTPLKWPGAKVIRSKEPRIITRIVTGKHGEKRAVGVGLVSGRVYPGVMFTRLSNEDKFRTADGGAWPRDYWLISPADWEKMGADILMSFLASRFPWDCQ